MREPGVVAREDAHAFLARARARVRAVAAKKAKDYVMIQYKVDSAVELENGWRSGALTSCRAGDDTWWTLDINDAVRLHVQLVEHEEDEKWKRYQEGWH
jgi:hypothetical protein